MAYFFIFRLSELIWRQDDGKGLSFNYPHIALHAISSDLNAFPHECLYLIIDKEALEGKFNNLRALSNNNLYKNFNNCKKADEPTEDNENQSDDSDEIEPLRFVPDDRTFLDPLFKAINECQAMHPDPEDLSDGGEDEGEEEEQEEDENDFRDADDDQQIENFIQANQNVDNIELSDRGRRILNRLNINYENHSKINLNVIIFT